MASIIVAGMVLLRQSLAVYVPAPLYLLFFPAILINAALFDRGTGIYSVVLSAALARYFYFEPTGSFALADARTNVGLLLFIGIGCAISFIIEALHTTAHRLIEANQRLAAAEREKELLFQEAGHRIKNDLAMIVALVRLQERTEKDPHVRDTLATTANRIHVLSRVHERLHPGEGTTSVINIADFITDLCEDITASLIGARPIAIRTKVERHWLSQERSVPIGIIVNELVTNCLKYAFPDDRSGTIVIGFVRQDECYELTVTDDGIGPTHTVGTRRSSGLGQRLVHSMAAQLGGTAKITFDGPAGACATVRFPVSVG
ncbi:sensor histidine kinase [Microvirga puerhi]|nr:histidine kinase dimerization/phosphoacceptor domain -containing protein [Microvirga puerhi]